MFEKINRKSNSINDGNLGVALCLFGMAFVMFKNPFNFKIDGMDEDKCLRHVTGLLEQAVEIYKRRDHFGPASHCLHYLSLARKKLSMSYIHLSNESR